MERRLCAIFAADMVGFSRLMEADEIGTLKRQKVHRAELIDPAFQEFRGRVVKEMGDGILVEFASVVEAVQCAVKIQREMSTREADIPDDRNITYRIGINLGDIVTEDNDIHGDGVNVASRLEALAEPGGICISGTAFDQMRSAADVGYKSLGEVKLKNIERPIRAYEILLDPEEAGDVIEDRHRIEPADPEKFAFTIPEKPSIAVLPFDILSGDAKQDYLGDSLTENIIAELATSPDLMVIARNSMFTYKNKPTKVQHVAEQLGVRFVLDGSVQTFGDRLRVVAQLIDALDGKHLWADRYDYEIEDIFAIQDDITSRIAEELEVKLALGEQLRIWRKEASDSRIYKRGAEFRIAFQRWNSDGHQKAEFIARELFDKHPDHFTSHATMAWLHWQKALGFGYSNERSADSDRTANIALAREYAEKASSLFGVDRSSSYLHILLACIDMIDLKHQSALKHVDRAQKVAPSEPYVYEVGGYVRLYSGEVEQGTEMLQHAMRIEPVFPLFVAAHVVYGFIYLGRFAEAKALAEEIINKDDRLTEKRWALTHMIALLIFQDSLREAKNICQQLIRLAPRMSVSLVSERMRYHADQIFVRRYVTALREAGLPK